MSQAKTPPAKDAGAQYAEIWGEAVHTNRHLRTITVGLGIAVILGSSGKWGGAASQRQAAETAALCKPWKNK